MAVDLFIPEVWAAQLLVQLEKRHVFGQAGVSNRNYEGEIAEFGDTVHIGSLTQPTISTYTKNSTTISPQVLTTTDQTLVIDQSKYFAFQVDDIDARQVRDSGNLLSQAAEQSAYGLSDIADQFLAGLMTTGAGTILTPAALTTSSPGAQNDAYLLVRKMKVTLDKANVPADGRFLIVAPEFYAVLLGDQRFIAAYAYGSTAPIMNGEVGKILGFTVLQSNNNPVGTAATAPAVSNFVVAGHPMALTYAEQISKVEAYRPQSAFSDALKGLHLYGAKVVRPEALVVQDTDVTVI